MPLPGDQTPWHSLDVRHVLMEVVSIQAFTRSITALIDSCNMLSLYILNTKHGRFVVSEGSVCMW